jgi:hypothetical protein
MKILGVVLLCFLPAKCQIDPPINLVIEKLLFVNDSLCITATLQNESNETVILFETDDYNLPTQVNALHSIPKEFKCFEPILTYGISILLTDSAGVIAIYRDDDISPLTYGNNISNEHETSFSRHWVDRRDSVRAGKRVLKKGETQHIVLQIPIGKFELVSGVYRCQLIYLLGPLVFDFVEFETDVFQGCVKSEAVSIYLP